MVSSLMFIIFVYIAAYASLGLEADVWYSGAMLKFLSWLQHSLGTDGKVQIHFSFEEKFFSS